MGNNLSNRYFRIGMLWIAAGVTLGIGMAASHDHSLAAAHAHMNLLGFVVMSVFAFFYRLWPEAGNTRLARIQFWTYVPSHFVQMVCLAILLRGNPGIEPVLAIASMVVGIGILMFIVNAWRHTGSASAQAPAQGAAAAG